MSEELPQPPQSEEQERRQTVVLLAILIEGGLLAGASLLGWIIDKPPLRYFDWTLRGVLWGIAATLPLIALFFLLLRWPIGPLKRIQRFSEEVIRPLLAPCSLVDLFGISALAGLGEETLFRGVLQAAFTEWFNVWVGVAVASLLFGLLHAITITYALLAAIMGAYLSSVWILADQNLLVIVITHALYDFVVLLWLLRGPGAAAALASAPPSESAEQTSQSPSEPP